MEEPLQGQNLEGNVQEHLKAALPIYDLQSKTSHSTSVKDFNIVSRKEHNLARYISHFRVNDPTLYRNIGKFNLPPVWDRVLLNTTGLKVKNNKNIKCTTLVPPITGSIVDSIFPQT